MTREEQYDLALEIVQLQDKIREAKKHNKNARLKCNLKKIKALSKIGIAFSAIPLAGTLITCLNGWNPFKLNNEEIPTLITTTIDKDGMIVALKKGSTTITATLESGYQLTTTLKVTSNPTIEVSGKKYSKSKTYTVKKGKSLTVKITGKAHTVDNKYKSSNKKVAKVTSKKTAETVKIKGLKKGKSTVTVTVNGVAFKIKVKVK